MQISILTPEILHDHLPGLSEILCDSVNNGASIGFWPPLDVDTAADYWSKLTPEIASGSRILIIAQLDNRVAGTVMLELSQRANGRHRAEVQKLLVHTDFRRRGIARKLLEVIDQLAPEQGRTLLVLDTRRGDAAEQLYSAYGYEVSGIVPDFTVDENGNYHDTVYFHRLLEK